MAGKGGAGLDAAALLAGAEAARSRPVESAAAIDRALEAAPDDPEVRLAACRFHFYAHDHAAALIHARALLLHAARRLNLPADPELVRPGDADFPEPDFAPGLHLQALVAIGYCAARLGDGAQARVALAKAAALDPSDRFGGARLLARVEAAGADEDDRPRPGHSFPTLPDCRCRDSHNVVAPPVGPGSSNWKITR